MTKVLENGVMRDMTSAEIEVANAHTKVNQDAKTAKVTAETTTENNKTSGKAKLKAGEALTDAEVSALFGA